MTDVLNILIVEDSSDDVELISRTLLKAGLQTKIEVVDSLLDLERALSHAKWDLILSDFNLPGFDGAQALERSRSLQPSVPFILVSGAVGEERAVDLMHAGARDFVSKSNLSRLVPTLQRELDVRNRADLLRTELLSTLETMSEGFLTLDPDWVVTYVNHEAEISFGEKRAVLRGKKLSDIFPSGDLDRFLDRYRRVMRTGVPEKFTEKYEDRVFHIHAIRTPHGGISIFFRDITIQAAAEKRQLELFADLETAKREAERANHLKSAFLANMSHEIRTPLGAILGFADLLRDPTTDEEEKKSFLDIIVRSGHQLSHLINDILDLSKVESGHLSVEKLPINPVQSVEEVLTLLELKAREKGIRLTMSKTADIPSILMTDPVRFKQIITNIVGNAVKFTPAGQVHVLLSRHSQGIAIEVRDTGIGMNPVDAASLFEVFRQADNSITRKFGGTGLGLALSRALAQALGGDVVLLRSELGKGTTFQVTIQNGDETTNAEASDTKVQTVSTSKNQSAKTRVLLVEDVADNQVLVCKILRRHGIDVEIADNAPEGIQKALKSNYEMILMDLQMPGMDGFTATQHLREQGYQQPIIALTAHAMNEVRLKCLDVGFTDHLTKPIDPESLIAMVRRHGKNSP